MLTSNALIHAPPLSAFLKTPLCPLTDTKHGTVCSSMAASARIAVVGDVHDDWSLEEDTKALQFLQQGYLQRGCCSAPESYLYTSNHCPRAYYSIDVGSNWVSTNMLWKVVLHGGLSDFGNENVELVQSVADLEFPKAVILGNHDSWTTQQFSAKGKDGVQLQLESLGEQHVGYRRLDFPALKLSIVGGRPFSCGGEQLFRKKLLSARYGVKDMEGSTRKIYNATLGTPEDHMVIVLAHNGPTGLGSNLNDICGKDWVFGAGDHGDPDLEQAISHLKQTTNLNIALVVFGHMHKELAYGNGLRKMIVVGADNRIYLNGAIVPRVKASISGQEGASRSFTNDDTPASDRTTRAFTIVDILEGRVDKVTETWVSVCGDKTSLQEEHLLFKYSN